jgi:hypothetical protein
MKRGGPLLLTIALSAFSCSESKDGGNKEAEQENLAVSSANDSAIMEIDTTSRTDWVGLDLDSKSYIAVSDFPHQSQWDLAFKRTSIRMNATDVQMQTMDKDFAAIRLAPKDGYISDQAPASADAPETSGLAFHAEPVWYSYNIDTHVVSSRGLTYVIKSNEGRYFKLKILDYYNAARLPAYINLEFQELEGVEP